MVDLAQTVNEWKDVESNKEDEQYLGDICFSLRYVPNSGKVSFLDTLIESWNHSDTCFLKIIEFSCLNSPELKFVCFNIVCDWKRKIEKQRNNTGGAINTLAVVVMVK